MKFTNIKFYLQLEDSVDNQKFAPIVEQALTDKLRSESATIEADCDEADESDCLTTIGIVLTDMAFEFISEEMGEHAIANVTVSKYVVLK